jgi:predicted small secreted protein
MKSLSILTVAILFLTTLLLGGCNATKGAGQDIENTGRNIKHTVDKND